jgi:hypothetical protein
MLSAPRTDLFLSIAVNAWGEIPDFDAPLLAALFIQGLCGYVIRRKPGNSPMCFGVLPENIYPVTAMTLTCISVHPGNYALPVWQ